MTGVVLVRVYPFFAHFSISFCMIFSVVGEKTDRVQKPLSLPAFILITLTSAILDIPVRLLIPDENSYIRDIQPDIIVSLTMILCGYEKVNAFVWHDSSSIIAIYTP